MDTHGSECKLNAGYTLNPAMALVSGQSFWGTKQARVRAFQEVNCHLLKTLVTSCLWI